MNYNTVCLDVLICTFNASIGGVEAVLLPPRDDVRYKISHQYTDGVYGAVPEWIAGREDVEVSVIDGRGVSANRNNALSMATADICLISDDDVRYRAEYFDAIIDWHERLSGADVIVGQIETLEGEPPYKSYADDVRRLGKRDVRYISSVEISFKRLAVVGREIRFDERFGLGSTLYGRGGEENAFIADCLGAGLDVQYVPSVFVHHTYNSVGRTRRREFSAAEVEFRAAYAARIFGAEGVTKNYIRCITEYPEYRAEISPKKYLAAVRRGNKCKK